MGEFEPNIGFCSTFPTIQNQSRITMFFPVYCHCTVLVCSGIVVASFPTRVKKVIQFLSC